jgi:hypothetical protein
LLSLPCCEGSYESPAAFSLAGPFPCVLFSIALVVCLIGDNLLPDIHCSPISVLFWSIALIYISYHVLYIEPQQRDYGRLAP